MLLLNDNLIQTTQNKASSIWLCNNNVNLDTDIVRVIGARVEADRRHLTLFIPVAHGAGVISNFATTNKLTFLTAVVYTYESYQIKGKYISHRACTEEDLAYQETYMDGFTDALAVQGLSKERSYKAYFHQPTLAVVMLAEEVFEQTPKKGTGEKLSISSN